MENTDKKETKLFGLSTCGWCKKTVRLLDDLNVDYKCIYVDLLEGDERDRALAAMRAHNPGETFPTLVIDDAHCIIGFNEEKIREEFDES